MCSLVKKQSSSSDKHCTIHEHTESLFPLESTLPANMIFKYSNFSQNSMVTFSFALLLMVYCMPACSKNPYKMYGLYVWKKIFILNESFGSFSPSGHSYLHISAWRSDMWDWIIPWVWPHYNVMKDEKRKRKERDVRDAQSYCPMHPHLAVLATSRQIGSMTKCALWISCGGLSGSQDGVNIFWPKPRRTFPRVMSQWKNKHEVWDANRPQYIQKQTHTCTALLRKQLFCPGSLRSPLVGARESIDPGW